MSNGFQIARGYNPAGQISYPVHDQMVKAVGRRAADRFQKDRTDPRLTSGELDTCLRIECKYLGEP